jgi:hypothetical protein
MFPGGEPWQAGRYLAPGPAALGAGQVLVGRAAPLLTLTGADQAPGPFSAASSAST